MAAEVRGVLVSAMKAYLSKTYGPDAVERATATLPTEEQALIQRKCLDASFYPYDTMIALRHLMRPLATGQPAAADDLGAFLADYVFTGVYKPLLANDAPAMVAKITWVKDFFYRDLEKVESAMTGDSSCRVTYRYEEKVRPARAVCRSLGNFWARTLQLAGGKKVSFAHDVCICDGADHCEFSFRW
ncbi:MAG TPA: hypothetical protein VLV78_11775 [Thermoanaerobaculia bacterium]|nr:hypothetical protein [Thermoanaerobaculia bacterium]